MTGNAVSAHEWSSRTIRFFEDSSLVFTCLLIVMGAVTCAGWILNIPSIIGFVPNSPAMAPNTGLELILCGASLLLQWRPLGRAQGRFFKDPFQKKLGQTLAAVGLLIATLTLLEYLLGRNLGIDELFIRTAQMPLAPKRTAPEGTLAFIFSDLALLSYSFVRRIRLTQFFALVTGAFAILALLGYSLGEPVLYSALSGLHAVGMAFHTALAFLLISLAILGSRPTLGLMVLMSSRTSGGIVARRLLTTTLAIIPLLGILLRIAHAAGLPNTFEDTFSILVTIVIFAGLTWIVARRLRESELATREVEARYQGLVEQASDGIFVADFSGRYIEVNSAGAQMLGYEPSEIIGKAITDLLPPEDIARLADSKKHLLKPGTTQVAEWRLRKKNGTFLPVEVSAKILPDGRWQGFVRDITERKRIEAELQRMREEWTSVIAHDLRQPLGVISLCTQLLARLHAEEEGARIEGPETPETKIIQRLSSAARGMQRMIEDLLDSSRLEARQLKLEFRKVDLPSLAREVLEGMGYGAPDSPLRLELDPALSPIQADPLRVEQILGNLVSNALKYRARGTEVRVQARDERDQISVSVTNSGPGIPGEELPLLFSRFTRTAESKKAGIPGLGLGLYICKGLVEAHGGTIRAESVPGQATTFSFTLPKRQAGVRAA